MLPRSGRDRGRCWRGGGGGGGGGGDVMGERREREIASRAGGGRFPEIPSRPDQIRIDHATMNMERRRIPSPRPSARPSPPSPSPYKVARLSWALGPVQPCPVTARCANSQPTFGHRRRLHEIRLPRGWLFTDSSIVNSRPWAHLEYHFDTDLASHVAFCSGVRGTSSASACYSHTLGAQGVRGVLDGPAGLSRCIPVCRAPLRIPNHEYKR